MSYIVERDNKKTQYVSGFSPVMGTIEIVKGNYTHAGNKGSAYSNRVGEVEHEAEVEIEG